VNLARAREGDLLDQAPAAFGFDSNEAGETADNGLREVRRGDDLRQLHLDDGC
jgi:hypothetical protein